MGVVRDKDTGKPLAGVTIQNETYRGPGERIELRATTDGEGRYRLVGLGAGWQEREHTAFGYDLLERPERFARYRQGVEVVIEQNSRPVAS